MIIAIMFRDGYNSMNIIFKINGFTNLGIVLFACENKFYDPWRSSRICIYLG